MTTTQAHDRDNQDENLVENLNGLDDTDLSENDLIKLLAQIVREQNNEINKILMKQSDQAKKQADEQRRLSLAIEKLDIRLSSFLESQQQSSQHKVSHPDLIPSLVAKVDKLGSALLDQERERLEYDALQNASHPSPNNSNGLNSEELQSLTEALATRQLSMQFRIDELTETMNRQISMKNEKKPLAVQIPGQAMRPSHRSNNSTTTTLPATTFEHSRLGSDRIYNSPHRHTPHSSHDIASPIRSSRSNDSDFSIESFYQQATSLINKATEQDSSLSSHRKDLLNLKRRLAHAEKLIGATYRLGSFSIHGLSFYQDAAALRYISGDPAARDAFRMFYGSRIAAIDYADIAPSAVLASFDIISRVRCRHEMWRDDKLDVKHRIRCAAEQIVDDWTKSLPLRDGAEHVHVSARELQRQFNQLKLLCYREDVQFDFAWPEL
ncbi:hypothetical protein TSTA_025380 [Talaromyces stipitatus ATCC 10500]|uniref:Uncharacterized protein n=1 Tax=Talaromyces stipitatus (strain ATCC 10500 / CBS 375.48 / QM 6759 / NRRL 1006) TaxID=441959 RepID=B8M4M6_TALSN|nr:uncharacterized protein TSTA_025380 [Talaromyces stipitatus ATCC 10500]EED19221.1 hypothetical protein TSTA_025380 [Talaromyces stipitatus ATCC 10500]